MVATPLRGRYPSLRPRNGPLRVLRVFRARWPSHIRFGLAVPGASHSHRRSIAMTGSGQRITDLPAFHRRVRCVGVSQSQETVIARASRSPLRVLDVGSNPGSASTYHPAKQVLDATFISPSALLLFLPPLSAPSRSRCRSSSFPSSRATS